MDAAVLTDYGRIEYKQAPTPEPGEHQVRLRIQYASICGSDIHVFGGDFAPRTSLPLIAGHEFAGVVEAVGPGVSKLSIGQQVAVDPIIWCGVCAACRNGHWPACASLKLVGIDLDGGFAEYICVDESMAYPVPDTVAPEHAALVEILSIGFHACGRAGVGPDSTLAIYGAGRVGQSILQAARTRTDKRIFVVDVLPNRLAIIDEHFDNVRTINALTDDAAAVIRDETSGGVDIAFESVGHAHHPDRTAAPVIGCIDSIRGGGTVCVLGLGDDPVPVVFKRLIWKEGTLVTSRVSHGEFADAIAALSAGKLKPEAMITDILPLEQTQQAFERIIASPETTLKLLLKINPKS